jgi:translation initiation factor IF-3
VKVVDADGTMLGVMDTRDALAKAQEQSLDLVEVNGKTKPPTCKIIDYGKYKYDQAKKARESNKTKKSQELKEVKFRSKVARWSTPRPVKPCSTESAKTSLRSSPSFRSPRWKAASWP